MYGNYETPKVKVMALSDDVIRTSSFGVMKFNSNWLEGVDVTSGEDWQENE